MSRYRKIAVKVWGDERVRRLSKPQPCGLHLWIWFLACPRSVIIPGLIPAGRMSLAEELGWSLEGFDKAFGEVFREGLAEADWDTRLVWIPKAICHNEPQSPNVIRSWRHTWEVIPECWLKCKAWSGLKAFVEGLPEGFRKAFAEACPEPSVKPLANQEQEQEEEKIQNTPAVAVVPSPKAEPKPKPEREPLPFTVAKAVEAVAGAAGEAFVSGPGTCSPGVASRIALSIRKGVTLADFALLGEYLAAGAESYRLKVPGPSWLAEGEIGTNLARAKDWAARGKGPLGRGRPAAVPTPPAHRPWKDPTP